MNEVDLIIHVISGGVILLLLLIIYRLVKKITRMYDRINAADDYFLTKFLTNEREKNRIDRDRTTGNG